MDNIIHLGQCRRVWFAEKPLLLKHLLRLDDDGRRSRFRAVVSDEFIQNYVRKIDDSHHLVHGCFKDGEMCGAAELVKLDHSWGPAAEAAFSVDKEYQNQGIGTELMGRVIRSARNRGVRELHISCLASNTKMQSIASKYDAHLRFEDGETLADIYPSFATYYSLLEEAVDDGGGMMRAVLDMQQRYLKVA